MRYVFLFLACVLLIQGAAAQASGPAASDVTLQAGDVVRVVIWREPDLSGEFPVDQDGIVTLPLLGDRAVTGIPLRQLRGELLEEYRIHLHNPSINVTPLRRVNILGEVNRPGLYEVDPTISLAGAVALAGGASPLGDLNRIRIIRQGQVVRERAAATTALTSADIRSGDQILVDRRGWFDRNSTFVVSVLLSITSIVISLAR